MEEILNEIRLLRTEIDILKASRTPPKKESRVQCSFITKSGSQCKKYAQGDCETCKVHSQMPKTPEPTKVRCTFITKSGSQCKKYAQGDCETCKVHSQMTTVKPVRVQCTFITKSGSQCKKYAQGDCETCKVHGKTPKTPEPTRIQCTFITKSGSQCKRYGQGDCDTCKVHSVPPKVKAPKEVCGFLSRNDTPCKNVCMDGFTFCARHDPNAPYKKKYRKPVGETFSDDVKEEYAREIAFWRNIMTSA
jgi:hypothetical protein